MDLSRDHQIERLKRHPVNAARCCSLRVITFEGFEWISHSTQIVDISMTGVGLESDRPIKPGIILFKECIWGYKFGTLVWCKRCGVRYGAGIQFVRLNRREEEYLKRDMKRSQSDQLSLDPEKQVEALVEDIMNKLHDMS